MEINIETITPEDAQAILGNHPANRKLAEARVIQLAGFMERGLFHFDGAPIRISKYGELLDGQHRLEALILSGKTMDFLVIRGLDPSVQVHMDTGRSRTLADQLDIRGQKSTASLAALIVSAQSWDLGRRGRSVFAGAAGSAPSYEEFSELLRSAQGGACPRGVTRDKFLKEVPRNTSCLDDIVVGVQQDQRGGRPRAQVTRLQGSCHIRIYAGGSIPSDQTRRKGIPEMWIVITKQWKCLVHSRNEGFDMLRDMGVEGTVTYV